MKILQYLFILFIIIPIYSTDQEYEINKSFKLGKKAYLNGFMNMAIKHFDKAYKISNTIDHSSFIANNAYHLALCYVSLGKYKNAYEFLDEAVYELKKLNKDISHILILKSRIALKKNNFENANRYINEVLNKKNINSQTYFQACIMCALIACKKNDTKKAYNLLTKAKKKLKDISNDTLLALYHEVFANYYALNKEYEKAALNFENSIKHNKRALNYSEIINLLELQAINFNNAKLFNKANECYYRASRSLFGQDKIEDAKKFIGKISFDNIDDDLKQRIDILKQKLNSSIINNNSKE